MLGMGVEKNTEKRSNMIEKFDEFIRAKHERVVATVNSMPLWLQLVVLVSSVGILIMEIIANH